jgi:hypothetical protein
MSLQHMELKNVVFIGTALLLFYSNIEVTNYAFSQKHDFSW